MSPSFWVGQSPQIEPLAFRSHRGPLWQLPLQRKSPKKYNSQVKQNATTDTSFWINVHRSGLLPHVLERYQLYYAPEVAKELREEFPSGREFWRFVREGILIEAVPNGNEITAFGPGERAAINLALEHRSWTLLMDDRRPFLEAMGLGLRVLCSPVLAVELYSEEVMDEAQVMQALARLTAMQRISPELIRSALAQLGRVWKGG